MKKTFVIQVEYPDNDVIPSEKVMEVTQECIELYIALTLAAFSGMLLHPNNNGLTHLLALIPCVVACCIIKPIIKEDERDK